MNKKNTLVAFVLLMSGLVFSAGPVSAAPLQSNQSCSSQIQLPQAKEELELGDVKQAIKVHLLRIGATGRDVNVRWLDEEVIVADIVHRGRLLRKIKVDASNAAIVDRKNYGRPVGFETPQYRRALIRPDLFTRKVRYTRQLRRHMLGDGKTWAKWIKDGPGVPGAFCFDDYRFGGPAMEEPGT